MSIKGFSSSKGVIQATLSSTVYLIKQVFATLSRIGGDKVALDTAPRFLYQFSTGAVTAQTGNTELKRIIKITAHGLLKGQSLRFTSGNNSGEEAGVEQVIDANTILLASELPYDVVLGDAYDVLKYITPSVDQDGSMVTVESAYSVLDRLDLGILDMVVSGATIPKSSTAAPYQIVASLASRCRKVRSQDTIGKFLGLYSIAAGPTYTLLAQLGPGGSEKEIDIPAGTVLGLKNLVDQDITASASAGVGDECLILEFIG